MAKVLTAGVRARGRVESLAARIGNSVLVLLVLVVTGACESPKTAFDHRLDSGPFSFVMGQGSGWHGYDVLRVAASGECWYTFSELDGVHERVVWREARFKVPDATVRSLKQELNDVAYFSLNDEYKGPAAPGREQWFFKVRIGEHKKAVFLDNYFPLPAWRLEKFVSERVLDPHRDEFKTARAIPADQATESIRF